MKPLGFCFIACTRNRASAPRAAVVAISSTAFHLSHNTACYQRTVDADIYVFEKVNAAL
jgi:hypothetical protein